MGLEYHGDLIAPDVLHFMPFSSAGPFAVAIF
jgi:hypothetical protein